MSGLAAIFNRDGLPVDRSDVGAMLAAVPYRGPDGQFMRIWQSVGLGHAKLAVTAEEQSEQQPLVSPGTRCAIIADARIDNRDELLKLLPHNPPFSISDADLILRAYEAWGPDGVAKLLGDFAFVIWDPRQQRIVCARDTSGQRSLFYRLDPHTFAAASEIHQLLQDPSVPMVANEERIREYLVPFSVFRNEQEKTATFYKGVNTLPSGHVLIVDASDSRLRSYWELRPPKEIQYRNQLDYGSQFVNLLGEAVRGRLRSSSPVGAMLSGGLDSTSVVSLAQQLYQLGLAEDRGFMTFSLLWGDLDCDETPYIRDVQAKYGFDARYIQASSLSSTFDLHPQGFMRAPLLPDGPLDIMLNAASDAGARVLLSGMLADNLFPWSWHFLGSLLRRRRFGEFWRYFQRFRGTESTRKILLLYTLLPLFPRELQRPIREGVVRREFERERHELVPEWMPHELRAQLLNRHLAIQLDLERTRRFSDDPREQIARTLYPAEVAPVVGTVPVQLAAPFADRRLHEYMLAIPPEQIFEPHPYAYDFYAGLKVVLRRGMYGILPESVRTRTQKTLFRSVFVEEMQRRWAELSGAFGPGASNEVTACGYVEAEPFWERLQRFRDGDYGLDGMYITKVLNLETWLRTLRLGRPPKVASAYASIGSVDSLWQPTRTAGTEHPEDESSTRPTGAVVSLT